MKIPKKIHFSGFDYKVRFEKDLEGGEIWGRTTAKNQEIVLEEDVHLQKQEQTFIHELMHIAFKHTNGWEKFSGDEEERMVKSWSMNIYGILKDNNLLK